MLGHQMIKRYPAAFFGKIGERQHLIVTQIHVSDDALFSLVPLKLIDLAEK
ncbi:hypothetical protein SAMN03159341_12340 [Paenibacillus sp. 1_12]|nr:hypothetical protein SAMN03159341_12340 [Paenibacillus sp. 1_12]